ncbi:vegetative cell wall protein gp1-like [Panicum virgatum]|uniref:vegetative cell wall protein gp1-like n=1 Tax=Panicum virgatum TaxID=38727 RepID=UPI0019D63968|nr:vegetative cell wall protein gp1-like [Panicum virgatum]
MEAAVAAPARERAASHGGGTSKTISLLPKKHEVHLTFGGLEMEWQCLPLICVFCPLLSASPPPRKENRPLRAPIPAAVPGKKTVPAARPSVPAARTEVPAAASAAVERSGRTSPSPPSRAPRSGRTPAPSRPPRPGRRAVDPGNADPSRDLSTDVPEALDAAPLDPARCAIRTARDTDRRPDQGSTPPSPPAHRTSTSPGGCWAARLPPLRRTAPGLLPAAARPSPVLFAGGWLGALAPGAQAWTCVLQVQLKSCSGRQGASGT